MTIILSSILLWLAFSISSFPLASGDPYACLCSYGNIPVPVDVKIPVDPAEGLNTTNLRRLKTVFNIFGAFCLPSERNTDRVQLLLHGSTYTHQYWTFPMNGAQNYSYVAHACARGQATFSYDQLGVGLSDRPANSSDIQLPVVTQIAGTLAKSLKDGTLSSKFSIGWKKFKKVIALGHSQGSVVFNFAAINEPTTSSIDAMILTGHIHDPGFLENINASKPLARDVDPARWGNLDSGYITSPNRSMFYSPDQSTFSKDVLMLDTLTKDVSAIWLTRQSISTYIPARGYRGPIVEMVGAFDQIHCLVAGDGNRPCDADALQTTEKPFFPDSSQVQVVIRKHSGHDLNLDFGAAETFDLYSHLVETLV